MSTHDPLSLPSSSDILLEKSLIFPALEIYEALQQFSKTLRLSPFTFELFCIALESEATRNLLVDCHSALLKSLLRENDRNNAMFSEHKDSKDAFSIFFFCMDHITFFELSNMYLQANRKLLSNKTNQELKCIFSKQLYSDLTARERLFLLKLFVDAFISSDLVRNTLDREDAELHEDFCRQCHKRGDLLCCESCTAVFHLGCVTPPLDTFPEGDWFCVTCSRLHEIVKKQKNILSDSGNNMKESGGITRGSATDGRRVPLGRDLSLRTYWFIADRVFVEKDGDLEAYYSSQHQFHALIHHLTQQLKLHQHKEDKEETNKQQQDKLKQQQQEDENKKEKQQEDKDKQHHQEIQQHLDLDQQQTYSQKQNSVPKQQHLDSQQQQQQRSELQQQQQNKPQHLTDHSRLLEKLTAHQADILAHMDMLADRMARVESYSKGGRSREGWMGECLKDMYCNVYAQEPLALSKQQQVEERERRRTLSHKFSLEGSCYFQWLRQPSSESFLTALREPRVDECCLGPSEEADARGVLQLLRGTLLHLRDCIPKPFLHANWTHHNARWTRAVRICTKAHEFALALLILHASIKPFIFHDVWHKNAGHLQAHVSTATEREADRRQEQELKSIAREEALGTSPLKNPHKIKHQLWKQRGEEYRMTGRHAWMWIGPTRRSRAKNSNIKSSKDGSGDRGRVSGDGSLIEGLLERREEFEGELMSKKRVVETKLQLLKKLTGACAGRGVASDSITETSATTSNIPTPNGIDSSAAKGIKIKLDDAYHSFSTFLNALERYNKKENNSMLKKSLTQKVILAEASLHLLNRLQPQDLTYTVNAGVLQRSTRATEAARQGGLPKSHRFQVGRCRRLVSVYVLEKAKKRKLARKGGAVEVSGYVYHPSNFCAYKHLLQNWKSDSNNHVGGVDTTSQRSGKGHTSKGSSKHHTFSLSCAPRPTLVNACLYKLTTQATLSSVALHLRVLWACLRWEELYQSFPASGLLHLEHPVDPSSTTTCKLIKRRVLTPKFDPISYKVQYLVQRSTHLASPGACSIPQDKGTSRQGLRERRVQEPVVSRQWVPEEQLELWQIRYFNSVWEKQNNGNEASALNTSSTTNSSASSHNHLPSYHTAALTKAKTPSISKSSRKTEAPNTVPAGVCKETITNSHETVTIPPATIPSQQSSSSTSSSSSLSSSSSALSSLPSAVLSLSTSSVLSPPTTSSFLSSSSSSSSSTSFLSSSSFPSSSFSSTAASKDSQFDSILPNKALYYSRKRKSPVVADAARMSNTPLPSKKAHPQTSNNEVSKSEPSSMEQSNTEQSNMEQSNMQQSNMETSNSAEAFRRSLKGRKSICVRRKLDSLALSFTQTSRRSELCSLTPSSMSIKRCKGKQEGVGKVIMKACLNGGVAEGVTGGGVDGAHLIHLFSFFTEASDCSIRWDNFLNELLLDLPLSPHHVFATGFRPDVTKITVKFPKVFFKERIFKNRLEFSSLKKLFRSNKHGLRRASCGVVSGHKNLPACVSVEHFNVPVKVARRSECLEVPCVELEGFSNHSNEVKSGQSDFEIGHNDAINKSNVKEDACKVVDGLRRMFNGKNEASKSMFAAVAVTTITTSPAAASTTASTTASTNTCSEDTINRCDGSIGQSFVGVGGKDGSGPALEADDNDRDIKDVANVDGAYNDDNVGKDDYYADEGDHNDDKAEDVGYNGDNMDDGDYTGDNIDEGNDDYNDDEGDNEYNDDECDGNDNDDECDGGYNDDNSDDGDRNYNDQYENGDEGESDNNYEVDDDKDVTMNNDDDNYDDGYNESAKEAADDEDGDANYDNNDDNDDDNNDNNDDNDDEKVKLHCICATPYDESRFYIGCDVCQGWFHGECMGISVHDAVDMTSFSCPSCR